MSLPAGVTAPEGPSESVFHWANESLTFTALCLDTVAAGGDAREVLMRIPLKQLVSKLDADGYETADWVNRVQQRFAWAEADLDDPEMRRIQQVWLGDVQAELQVLANYFRAGG